MSHGLFAFRNMLFTMHLFGLWVHMCSYFMCVCMCVFFLGKLIAKLRDCVTWGIKTQNKTKCVFLSLCGVVLCYVSLFFCCWRFKKTWIVTCCVCCLWKERQCKITKKTKEKQKNRKQKK